MSEVERLKEQIKYFSVLIQKHKTQSASAKKVGTASKYRWSKDSTTISSNTTIYPKIPSNSFASQSRKRSSHEINDTAMLKFSKRHVVKAQVTFDPKFKWSKGVQSSMQSSVLPRSSSSIPASSYVPFSTTTSSITAKPTVLSATTVPSNSKYKYHRSAPSNPRPTIQPAVSVSSYSGFTVHKPSHSHQNKLSVSAYKFKAKRLPRHKDGSHSTNKNLYKIHHRQQGFSTPHRRGVMSKSPAMRNFRKMSPVGKRRRSIDSSTHITLSRAALEDLLKKHSVTLKQTLANKAVVKSHETSRTRQRSLDKAQQHCLYYGRFGKCMRGGSCKFIHDPSKIAICTRFLRGTCRDTNCSFSHKVEKEKVPLCLFFIRGKCTVPDCPYLHVFLGKDAPVCKRFATAGFCPNGDKCKEQHIKCCPDFYETGKCQKGISCSLSHFKMRKSSAKKVHSAEKTRSEDVTVDAPGSPTKVSPRNAEVNEEYLSLEVDAPAPINVPVRREPTLIKPRFGKLKTKKLPSQ